MEPSINVTITGNKENFTLGKKMSDSGNIGQKKLGG
jgi:hypothetical protein